MSKDKKTLQLGMNPSTASGRLVKDLLFDFVQKAGIVCHHCGGEMSRDTFSVEHKTPWLDSEDPLGLFFNLENISYSHLSCNTRAARKIVKYKTKEVSCGTTTGYSYGCRCNTCKNAKKVYDSKRVYDSTKRRDKYLRLKT